MSISTTEIESIVKKIVSEMSGAGATGASCGYEIPVGISNRHIHLTKEDLETLFGKGYELTHLKDLSQPGQYACKEVLTIVGPSMKAIEGVRVLGPLRKASQVEISVTDSYVLKVKPPVRESGKLEGSSPITIIGPKGIVKLKSNNGVHELQKLLINVYTKKYVKRLVKARGEQSRFHLSFSTYQLEQRISIPSPGERGTATRWVRNGTI